MNTRRKSPFLLTALMFIASMFFVSSAFADEMTQSLMFDDASYTVEVEKTHHKLHMIYGKAIDKSATAVQRLKARKEFLDVAQNLNKKMHARVMTKDPKKGDALSHTDVLTATHLLLMTADMLTTIQQDEWAIDPGMTGSE